MTSMLLLTVLEVSGPFADKHDPNLSPQTVEKLYQGSGSYLEKAFGAANFRARTQALELFRADGAPGYQQTDRAGFPA